MRTACWTKACLAQPHDNFPPSARSTQGSFKPSFESDKCDPPMALLLGGEYGRIWHREHENYLQKALGSQEVDKALQRKRILESSKRIQLKRKKKVTSAPSLKYMKTKLPKKRKIRCDIKDDLIKPKKVPVEKPPDCVPCTCKIPKPAEPVLCNVCGMTIPLAREPSC